MKQSGFFFIFWYLVTKFQDWRKKVTRVKAGRRAAATRRARKQRLWEVEVLEREYEIAKGLAKRPIGRLREEFGIARKLATKPIKVLERELELARGLIGRPKPRTARRNKWV